MNRRDMGLVVRFEGGPWDGQWRQMETATPRIDVPILADDPDLLTVEPSDTEPPPIIQGYYILVSTVTEASHGLCRYGWFSDPRCDALKMATAAAAGSAAFITPRHHHGTIWPAGSCAGLTPEQAWDAGFQAAQKLALAAMYRLEQAIKLGDKTAEELGAEFHIHRKPAPHDVGGTVLYGKPRTIFCVLFLQDLGDWNNPEAWTIDPDPLTAVHKAREAALEWKP